MKEWFIFTWANTKKLKKKWNKVWNWKNCSKNNKNKTKEMKRSNYF